MFNGRPQQFMHLRPVKLLPFHFAERACHCECEGSKECAHATTNGSATCTGKSTSRWDAMEVKRRLLLCTTKLAYTRSAIIAFVRSVITAFARLVTTALTSSVVTAFSRSVVTAFTRSSNDCICQVSNHCIS